MRNLGASCSGVMFRTLNPQVRGMKRSWKSRQVCRNKSAKEDRDKGGRYTDVFSVYINGKPCSHDNTFPSPFHADNGLLKQKGAVELGLGNTPKVNKCTESVLPSKVQPCFYMREVLWEVKETRPCLLGNGSYTDNHWENGRVRSFHISVCYS